MVNYLTFGYDCSPAAALRNLNRREVALPFDWVQSNITSLQLCFETNFQKFHTGLTFTNNKMRLVDVYGFQFPHDYPTQINTITDEENLGEGTFTESRIVDNYVDFQKGVGEKYARRINRFINIINDPLPIVVLCRYDTQDVINLQKLLIKYYNRPDIYFINSAIEVFENDKIKNIYTENSGVWNDVEIWRQGIDSIILKNNLL